ncbi:MAG: M20/M25/M40 family metallo-hydrolase [Deltaproteobacteria bacterium]|nr:M20/M25/M40 family metallo-hydrolase [Deltaproteobacteria bacterium]
MTQRPQVKDWNRVEEDALALFARLLMADTRNPPGNEALVAGLVREELERVGLKPTVVEKVPGRSNLVLRLPGSGTGPSLLLDSHADVVGVREEEWTVPPFAGQVRDGCIWGRGALDMKHMTAMSTTVVATLHRLGVKLAGDLTLAITADEEDGGDAGVRFLCEEHPGLVKSDFALGEVGGFSIQVENQRFFPVQVAEKGACRISVELAGTGGHGSVPNPDSAPARLGKVLERIRRLRFPIAPHPAARVFLESLAEASPLPQKVALSLLSRGVLADFLLDHVVPEDRRNRLKAMLSNTCQATMVNAGERSNVVPTRGVIELDCRVLPGVDPREMEAEVQRAMGPLGKAVLRCGWRGHATSLDNPLLEQIRRTVSVMDPGAVVTPYLMPAFTNGGAYSTTGVVGSYLGFTPVLMPPSLDYVSLFHAPDERCPVQGFRWGVRTLFEVVRGFLEVP